MKNLTMEMVEPAELLSVEGGILWGFVIGFAIGFVVGSAGEAH